MGMHALPLIRTTTNSFLCGSLKNSSKSLVRRLSILAISNNTNNQDKHDGDCGDKHDFDFDIFVIGGGSGGVRASRMSSAAVLKLV